MKAKASRLLRRSGLGLLLLAVIAALVWIVHVHRTEPIEAVRVAEPSRSTNSTDPVASSLSDESVEEADAVRPVVTRRADAQSRAPLVAEIEEPSDVGWVTVRVRAEASTTRTPFEIRFLHRTRFGTRRGTGVARTALTAGTWEAVVVAPGFEPAFLGPFDVRAGMDLDLGVVIVRRGSGVIEGVIRSPESSQRAVLRLYGVGRSGCEHCSVREESDPCFFCGFAVDHTSRVLAGSRFRFDGLARGVYFLHLIHPVNPIRPMDRVSVGTGEGVWVDLTVEEGLELTFEVLTPRGEPVVVSREKGRGSVTMLAFTILEGGSLVAKASMSAYEFQASGSGGGGVACSSRDPRVDRRRVPGDTLLPDPVAPSPKPVELELRSERPGYFSIRPLPCRLLKVRIHAPSIGLVDVPVDPKADAMRPRRVVLRGAGP